MDSVEDFRAGFRDWLERELSGEYAGLKGRGGPGREHEAFAERLAWERHMAAHGWTCVGWPEEFGGRGASLELQIAFHEEYALADAPARVNHIGEQLLGPTLIAFGTEEHKSRFLEPIRRVEELWCQGYSEPGAGSDLAGVRTRARLSGDGTEWIVDGQKTWTSLAHEAQWCFVLARTEPGSRRHSGLSYLLVPLDQPGVEVRPIVQLTGTSEFNEVFFDGARTPASYVVGDIGDGWRIAMATLGFERGISTVGQQIGFRRELSELVALAERNGALDDPLLRDRLARAWTGLQAMAGNARRGVDPSVAKLYWAAWHRGLGELAMDVCGAAATVAEGEPYELDQWQRLFLFSRADTIYAGSDEIQRNIIAERLLGLPKEVRV
ncbi:MULTISPECIES: acyl-CoA dehydrogenase family protein [unclassified Streptomyces]|uniref:acyl-CoA dehydrogenase family protein n=1 Tax=unclassified Streptomyces TaxID=2593676 RepID=UPI00278C300E|nr:MULTISPECIES: acyl-CoA dehydrogenase family protein [unclassified Streptomyces]